VPRFYANRLVGFRIYDVTARIGPSNPGRLAELGSERRGDAERIACLDKFNQCSVTFFGPRRFIGMRRSSYYHAQADHARRLADITVQPNVEEILRRVAEELDHLAGAVAVGEPDFTASETQGRKPSLRRRRRTRSRAYPSRRNPSAR
jgi:hypothetical protein